MNNPCFILILNLQSLSKRCNLYVIFMKYLLIKKVKQQFGKNMKDLLQLSKDLTKIFMKFLSIFIQIDILHKNVLAHLVYFSFFLKIVFMNSAWKNIKTNNQVCRKITWRSSFKFFLTLNIFISFYFESHSNVPFVKLDMLKIQKPD